MGRYRNIEVRIWNDERFRSWDPIGQLVFFACLTHPNMTPMGAGILTPATLDEIAGNAGGFCFRCQDNCDRPEHRREGVLTPLKGGVERGVEGGSTVLYENGLLIVKNYLRYNCPETPHNLVSWIHSCEELPQSALFEQLRDHLRDTMQGEPEWLFAGLLDPLARRENHTLKEKFWDRVAPWFPKPGGRPAGKRNPPQNPPRKGTPNPSPKGTRNPPGDPRSSSSSSSSTSKTPPSPKGVEVDSRKSQPESNTPADACVAHFKSAYSTKRKEALAAPTDNLTKWLTTTLANFTPEEVARRIDDYFASTDKFIATNAMFSPAVFMLKFNDLKDGPIKNGQSHILSDYSGIPTDTQEDDDL